MAFETGHKISAAFHVGLIGAAVLGGPLFQGDPDELLTVSDVQIVSLSEFEAMNAAPEVPIIAPAPTQPELPSEDLSEAPLEPDEASETPGERLTEELGLIAPQEQIGELENTDIALATPKEAPRIADEANETPEPDAQKAPETVTETAPSEEVQPQEPPKEEQDVSTAPEESATQIVTEADETPQTAAPTKSIRPKARPQRFAERPKAGGNEAPEPKPTEQDQVAEDIAALLEQAQSQPEPSPIVGPPLTAGEREGLIFAIQDCWNVPVAIKDAADLKVTLKISLNREGRLQGNPELISPSSVDDPSVRQAFESGRRALFRCQPYKLPADKFETWKEIEITFNPQQMVLR